MDEISQTPFADSKLAENPEPRCPCILLLDRSGSMGGRPIDELNAVLPLFKQEVATDDLAAKRVEVAVVAFGGTVEVLSDFATVDTFVPPVLVASGETPMGQAINTALDLLDSRKGLYRTNGILYYRPWIFMITDGAPTDEWQAAAQRIKEYEANQKVAFFPVGVFDADMALLKQVSVRPPLYAQGYRFKEMFMWLTQTLSQVSKSRVGDTIVVPKPDWGTV
jgi:uncharacterized protein YegL